MIKGWAAFRNNHTIATHITILIYMFTFDYTI